MGKSFEQKVDASFEGEGFNKKIRLEGFGELNITYLKENGFEIDRPTILRFSNHKNNLLKSQQIKDCLNESNEDNSQKYNILDVNNVIFKELENALNEIGAIILQVEEKEGLDVIGMEMPFSSESRMYKLLEQVRLTGENLFLLRPIITDKEKTDNRGDFKTKKYEIFKPGLDYFLHAYEERLLVDIENNKEKKDDSPCLLRFSRHGVYEKGIEQLKNIYGDDISVREIFNGIKFKDTDDFLKLINDNIILAEKAGGQVKVIELIAPPHLVAEILYKGDFKERGIKLIRPSFKRENGSIMVKKSKREGAREHFVFESYNEMIPSNSKLSLFEVNKDLKLNFERRINKLRPVEIDENGVENLNIKEYREALEKVLLFMSKEKWKEAAGLLDLIVENELSKFDITVNRLTRYINDYKDFQGEGKSAVEKRGDEIAVTLESLELDNKYFELLNKKGFDMERLSQGLKIQNVFAFIEELLHFLQLISKKLPLLSSRGEMIYQNPYLQGKEAYQRKRNEFISLEASSLALEHDILCVFSDFDIAVSPLIWYGYQRFDLLEMSLGKNYQNIKIKLEDILSGNNQEIIEVDDLLVEGILKKKNSHLSNDGVHAVFKIEEDGYFLSYPDDIEEWSGWGIFYKSEEGFWNLVSEEGVKLPKNIKVRFGPAIELSI